MRLYAVVDGKVKEIELLPVVHLKQLQQHLLRVLVRNVPDHHCRPTVHRHLMGVHDKKVLLLRSHRLSVARSRTPHRVIGFFLCRGHHHLHLHLHLEVVLHLHLHLHLKLHLHLQLNLHELHLHCTFHSLKHRLVLDRVACSDGVGTVFGVLCYHLQAGVNHCFDGLVFLLTFGIFPTTNAGWFCLMFAFLFPFVL